MRLGDILKGTFAGPKITLVKDEKKPKVITPEPEMIDPKDEAVRNVHRLCDKVRRGEL